MMKPKFVLSAFAGGLGRAAGVALMAAGLVTGLAPAAGAAGVPCAGMTGKQPSGAQLTGVTVLSPCNVWAAQLGGSGIWHWDGAEWTAAVLPGTTAPANLTAIRAITASDIWTVGYTEDATGFNRTLIEHWDGSSWTVSPESQHPSISDRLTAVTATSSTNVWAVGATFDDTGVQKSVIEHWNGAAWTRLPAVPTSGERDELFGVAAVSPASAWAVGDTRTPALSQIRGLVLHWDGRSWSQVSVPANVTRLRGVAVVSANDAWAVGASGLFGATPVILHWDGSSWQQAATPPGTGTLLAVTATSATDAWAVGEASSKNGPGLIEHWDGTSWTVVPIPAGVGQLDGVSAGATGTAWATGIGQNGHAVALRLRAG